MPYARKSRTSRRPARRTVRRRRTYRPRTSRRLPLVRKTLGNGVQWHKSTFADTASVNAGYHYDSGIVAQIPRYYPQATPTDREVNLQQARLRDKIFLKGMFFRISLRNESVAKYAFLRMIILRNASHQELPSGTATNWFKDDNGNDQSPIYTADTLPIQRFNSDLIRTRKDLFYDRYFKLAPFTADGSPLSHRAFKIWIPVHQVCVWESTPADSGESDNLKTGNYHVLLVGATSDGSQNTGALKVSYSYDLVWAEN